LLGSFVQLIVTITNYDEHPAALRVILKSFNSENGQQKAIPKN
jgi:hypothetical protein